MTRTAKILLGGLLAWAIAGVPAARAQHAQEVTAEKPWPRVGFVKILDCRTAMPELGHTRVEQGDSIMDLANAGDGSGRLFILERIGRVWIFQKGQLLPTPFLDITSLTDMIGEHGIISIAFPPDFAKKRHFYITYTNLDGNLILARYQTDPKDPNRALPGSGEILLLIHHEQFTNHYAAQIRFGPDGLLYLSTGDGGLANDTFNNGQNLRSYLAKILRFDVEGKPDPGKKYRVPPDNPFVKNPNALPEIWALGLRNPWRFCFDPANGDLYIGNVGQEQWESIYYTSGGGKGGVNYGWSIYEGSHTFKPQPAATSQFTFPVAEFSHFGAQQFHALIGGDVYRGQEFPDWQGVYFFSDWVTNQVWAMRRNADGLWQTRRVDGGQSPLAQTVAFGVDEAGNLFAVGFANGVIYKLIERPADK
jgi:glucose/arabinose dehydrogenase